MAKIDDEKFKSEAGGLWLGGVNSSFHPESLPQNQVSWGINVDNANGLISTRDGWTPYIKSPNGRQQMVAHFRDCTNTDWIVWGISGRLYASPFPFTQYRDLGVQLNASEPFLTHEVVERGARHYGDADPETGIKRRELIRPIRYLVVSDNTNKLIYWSGGPHTCVIDEAPIGRWLCFVNNRLFIGGGRLGDEIWWSDIADPLSFTDIGFLADGGQFRLRSEVRGLVAAPDGNSLIAFESGKAWQFATGTPIKTESQWKETPGFQSVLFPDIGCLAGKSFVTHFGDVWWWSNRGLMSLRRAAASNSIDDLSQADMEMTRSNDKFTVVLDNAVGVSHDNYFLMNTPVNEIWAKNNSPASLLNTNTPSAWLGVWTGFRVAEFCSFTSNVTGERYTFALSYDYDDQTRIWRLFNGTQRDGNTRIGSSCEFRGHALGTISAQKRFRWFDVNLQEIWGDVDVKGWYRGIKGGWKQVLTKAIKAAEDTHNGKRVGQFRKVYSRENFGRDACNSCGTEGQTQNDQIDYAFQFMLQWKGQASVDSYRISSFGEVEQLSGRCEKDEETATSQTNCGSPEDLDYHPDYPSMSTPTFSDTRDIDCDVCPSAPTPDPITYTATRSCTKNCAAGTGAPVTKSATATSSISFTDAADKAMADACAAAEAELECSWTETATFTATCPPPQVGSPVTRSATYTSTISQEDAMAQAMAAAIIAAESALVCGDKPEGVPLLIGCGDAPIYPRDGYDNYPRTIGNIKTDGSTEVSWGKVDGFPVGANGGIYAMCYKAGIGGFAAGQFSYYNGTAFPGLVKLDSAGIADPTFSHGWTVASWTPGQIVNPYTLPHPTSMEIGADGNVAMVTYGGTTKKWSTTTYPKGYILFHPVTGAIISTEWKGIASAGTTARVLSDPSDTLYRRYICGTFDRFVTGDADLYHWRRNLARLNQDGSLDETFLGVEGTGNLTPPTFTGPNGEVTDMCLIPGYGLLIVGKFSYVGSIPRKNVALLGADGEVLPVTFTGITGSCSHCLYDAETGAIYIAEEGKLLWKFGVNGVADSSFSTAGIGTTPRFTSITIVGPYIAVSGGFSISTCRHLVLLYKGTGEPVEYFFSNSAQHNLEGGVGTELDDMIAIPT